MQAVAIPFHAGESQLIPGGARALHNTLIHGAEWIRDSSAGVRTETLHQLLARARQFASDILVSEPRETAVCRPVRGEVKAARSPVLDLRPRQMLEPVPGVAHIPVVRLADVIGDQERRGREAEVGEDGIGVLGEGRVAVVERQ